MNFLLPVLVQILPIKGLLLFKNVKILKTRHLFCCAACLRWCCWFHTNELFTFYHERGVTTTTMAHILVLLHRDINPHIPQYIMNAPWYIHSKVPTLSHQRIHDEKKKVFATLDKWQKKGVKDGPVATKYRKGACENCGAMTHKKRDCLEVRRVVLLWQESPVVYTLIPYYCTVGRFVIKS